MEHSEIEARLIVDRYLLNKLSPEDASRFERHYLVCTACVEQLELGERWIRGLKRSSAEQLAGLASGWLDRVSRLNRLGPVAVWAAAATLALAVPSGLIHERLNRLGNELESTRSQLRGTLTRQADRLQLRPALEPGTRAPSHDQLAQERRQRLALEARAALALRPQANTPVLNLDRTRDSARDPAPSYRIELGERAEWWVLTLELEPPGYARYRVGLLFGAEEIWSAAQLRPRAAPDGETLQLSIGLHSSWLEAGVYTLRLEGIGADGRLEPAGRYAFSVLTAESTSR